MSKEPVLRNRALFATLYLTAARVGEIVPGHWKVLKRYVRDSDRNIIRHVDRKPVVTRTREPRETTGLRKCDILSAQVDGREVMVFRIFNEKNQLRQSKSLPVIVEREAGFVAPVKDYLDTLTSEAELFDFSTVTAWKVIRRMAGYHPHRLRHIRLTHLRQLYGFDHLSLMKAAGWTSPRQADRYIEISWQELLKDMTQPDKRPPDV